MAERIQLNLRLDSYPELYQAVKEAAAAQNTSINSFVVDALKVAVGMATTTTTTSDELDKKLEELVTAKVDELLEEKLDKALATRLGEKHAA